MSMSLTCNLRDRGEKGEGARLCERVCVCVHAGLVSALREMGSSISAPTGAARAKQSVSFI